MWIRTHSPAIYMYIHSGTMRSDKWSDAARTRWRWRRGRSRKPRSSWQLLSSSWTGQGRDWRQLPGRQVFFLAVAKRAFFPTAGSCQAAAGPAAEEGEEKGKYQVGRYRISSCQLGHLSNIWQPLSSWAGQERDWRQLRRRQFSDTPACRWSVLTVL